MGFAFIADKFIVNHFFEIEVANTYTFAWAVTAPMLYIGITIEHLIYASSKEQKRSTIFASFFLIFILAGIYITLVYLIVNLFPNLLPESINPNLFKSIITFLLVGYFIYTIIQFLPFILK